MPRYVKRAFVEFGEELEWVDDEPGIRLDLQVSDHIAVDTGLLDADGDAIMRLPNPIGFGGEL